MARLTKPVLEHVHGEGGWFLRPGFLVPSRISGEVFTLVVRRRGDIVPRLTGATKTAGSRGGVRNSEEIVKWVDWALEGLVRGVGGSLWWRSGNLNGHASTGDDGGRSCLRSGGGGDKIPRTGNGAGGAGGGLSGDGGGDDLGGGHFV
jgi:hypothetical protein